MCDEYGPPTREDDAWYTHAVASLDYPRVKRDPVQLDGQMKLGESAPPISTPRPGADSPDVTADDIIEVMRSQEKKHAR